MQGTCWLCGRNGTEDPLDRHHIYGGANRRKSERYGLTVPLCHCRCHIFGQDAVHRSGDTAARLKAWGQRKAMRAQGWSEEDFRRIFGKSYLTEEYSGEQILRSAQDDRAGEDQDGGIVILDEEVCFA